MWSQERLIKEGDTVIVFMTRDNMVPITVKPGQELQNRYGVYRHSDMVGKPYGLKMVSRNGRGFVYLLRPTPELWTLSLPHRTQIVYTADIAFVTSVLDIRAGSKVVEAGTGSGSFTHALARTVGKTSETGGRVHTFEFHEMRATKAKEEFRAHGIDGTVVIEHRNVCKDGFGLTGVADAVFLDLPAPWEAIPHAREAMRIDKTVRICCFSPCIEQVLRTVTALTENGFAEITTFETLVRTHETFRVHVPPVSAAVARLKEVEVKKEERRKQQIESARQDRERRIAEKKAAAKVDGGAEGNGGSTETEGGEGHEERMSAVKLGEGEGESEATKAGEKRKREDDEARGADDASAAVPNENDKRGKGTNPTSTSSPSSSSPASSLSPATATTLLSKPHPETRGHTSYLTFAVLLPRSVVQGDGRREAGGVQSSSSSS